MVQKARVRLLSPNLKDLEKVTSDIKEIVTKMGGKMYGPVPLPTKHLRITTRKSPCGEGTNTWEHYELRIHKRLIDIAAQERIMAMIMKIKIPDSVTVEIEL